MKTTKTQNIVKRILNVATKLATTKEADLTDAQFEKIAKAAHDLIVNRVGKSKGAVTPRHYKEILEAVGERVLQLLKDEES